MVWRWQNEHIRIQHFQYSLCRVVLMVIPPVHNLCHEFSFQYSLCRVVLMVLTLEDVEYIDMPAFSTRSVESF